MADLALTAAQIAVVYPDRAEMYTKTCGGTVTAGQTLYQDAAGKVQVADANAAGLQQTRFLALEAGGDGDTISVLKEGHVYGFTITQAYDAPLFQSDTAGAIADAAGTLTVPVGIVDAVNDQGTITKVVYFSARWRADYA